MNEEKIIESLAQALKESGKKSKIKYDDEKSEEVAKGVYAAFVFLDESIENYGSKIAEVGLNTDLNFDSLDRVCLITEIDANLGIHTSDKELGFIKKSKTTVLEVMQLAYKIKYN